MNANSKSELKMNALLSLYNTIHSEIMYYQNQGDGTNILSIVTIAIVPLLEVFKATDQIIGIVALFSPIIQLIGLHRSWQAHTFVAMLRGYAAYVEENINSIIEENDFIYNSRLIDKYIATQTVTKKSKLKVSWFLTILLNYAILGVCGTFFVISNKENPWYYLLIGGLVFLFYIFEVTVLCIKFCRKERCRYETKDLCLEINNKEEE